MRISPRKGEILEKLYTKAYVTEKTVESQARYTDFIDNSITIDEYKEIKNGISSTYLSYLFLSLMCSMLCLVFFWDKITLIYPTDDDKVYIAYAFGLSWGISFVLGYFRNRRNRKFLKWMKPYIENKTLEQFNKYEEKLKKREQFRAQKDQELRDKYLMENSELVESSQKAENSISIPRTHQIRAKDRISRFELVRALKKPSKYALRTNKITVKA